jgi:ABC-type sugar transport system ATPase subunit
MALDVNDLRVTHPSPGARLAVDGVSFTVRRGEIVGLAGLQGAGASETLHALFGALGSLATGRVRLGGEPFPMRSPQDSVERGVVLLTNDRKSLGLAPDLSVTHSVSLASLSRFCGRTGWVRRGAEEAAVDALTRAFNVHPPCRESDAPVRTLSGGNQQKVYLARCLLPQPRVLLLDEPTRGIDVAAKADIYELMRAWVGGGIAILLITSEMDELLNLSDRILVMHRGRVTAEFSRETASRDAVLAAAMGETGQRDHGSRA